MHLSRVHEPLLWKVQLGPSRDATEIEPLLRAAVLGPIDHNWDPPEWLQAHQIEAARRIRASLLTFGSALLADAVGLGKTYVALAVAATYHKVVVVVPAALASQWWRVSTELGVDVAIQTHDRLSRGKPVGAADLIVVDEAHRLRSPATRRYDVLARSVRRSHVLLVTATPVVNHGSDLVHLLRLSLPDNAFALLGLPSLERSLTQQDHELIVRAASAAIIARSPRTLPTLYARLPQMHDAAILRPPTARPRQLVALLRLIDQLEFPSLEGGGNSALLKMHLLYRLASSIAACRDTAKRHLAYLDRAITAAERGELLSRRVANQIFQSEDELRLELDDLQRVAGTIPTGRLRADRNRLQRLLHRLNGLDGRNPKAAALVQLLSERSGRKTIVFTTAVSTGLNLAGVLRWHRVAVVGSGRAWIASGHITVQEALSLFAPLARRSRNPAPSSRLDTLVATDLVSEGLDLQDADAIVHYDLPWTPLTLTQRSGRIARLGASHDSAEVWWFAPPQAIDRRLELEARIAEKVERQLALRVVTTSRVGQTRIVNQKLEQRELLGGNTYPRELHGPLHAVVRGPPSAAIAIRWMRDVVSLPELIVITGEPPRHVLDYAAMEQHIRVLRSAEPSPLPPPDELLALFLSIVRQRLAAADRGSCSHTTQSLARRVVRYARSMGRKRDMQSLDVLDAVLNRLSNGVSVGGERDLEQLLSRGAPREGLRDWVAQQPSPTKYPPDFVIDAAIFGDGTLEHRPDPVSAETLTGPFN